jgi:uncharacterized membrane protein YgcG
MRSRLVLIPLLIAMVGFAIVLAILTEEEARSIAIEEFHADLEVHEDGTTTVTETLRVAFEGEWNGIYREISLRHETASGKRERLRLEVEQVTDLAGEPLRHEVRRGRDEQELQIWVPDAVNAVRTVVIRYTVANALRFFEAGEGSAGHDELYWNVTGNAWQMPIRSARARIRLPERAAGIEAWAYTGAVGSTARDARVEVAGHEVRVQANPSFAPGEGLTVAVAWAPGAVTRLIVAPTPVTYRLHWPVSLPVLVLLVGFRQWWKWGREPRRGTIVVRYEPPEDMTPAEVGTLLDHKAQPHDLAATLIDLAVRGYLRIDEKRNASGSSEPDYDFHLLRPPAEWGEILPHERLPLEAMFSDRISAPEEREAVGAAPGAGHPPRVPRQTPDSYASVSLFLLSTCLPRVTQKTREAIYDRLLKRGFYARRPHHAGGAYYFLAFVLANAALFVALGTAADGNDPTVPLLGLGGTVVLLVGFALVMKARTPAGVRALEHILGFRQFLSRVESDRLRRVPVTPEMFERYLPYAMALRVESRWAAAFADLYDTPPSWYRSRSGSPFRTTLLARNLGRVSRETGRAMRTSGSGGGGRSGGGSGGGGGRGF